VPERPLAVSARLTELEKTVAKLVLDGATRDKMDVGRDRKAEETHEMVKQLSEAFLKPQPGHDKSLLDRVAAVTIRVERGEWSVRMLGIGAGLVVALGGAVAVVSKWGGGS
jgi:hypothetical protein